MAEILKRIIRAEQANVVLQDLQIHLRNKGDSIDLMQQISGGVYRFGLETVCFSIPLKRLIQSGALTLWDESGVNLTGDDALNALDLATIRNSGLVNVENFTDLFDTPSSYSGTTENLSTVVVNESTDGMIFRELRTSAFGFFSTTIIAGDYIIQEGDDFIFGSGDITITLPPSEDNTGRLLHIKNTGTNFLTVDPNENETIDDGLTAVLECQYESISLISDGSNWLIV